MSLSRYNTILRKLGFPQLRRANHFETRTNEYGQKIAWVVDQSERQALHGFATLEQAWAHAIQAADELPPAQLAILSPGERRLVDDHRRL